MDYNFNIYLPSKKDFTIMFLPVFLFYTHSKIDETSLSISLGLLCVIVEFELIIKHNKK